MADLRMLAVALVVNFEVTVAPAASAGVTAIMPQDSPLPQLRELCLSRVALGPALASNLIEHSPLLEVVRHPPPRMAREDLVLRDLARAKVRAVPASSQQHARAVTRVDFSRVLAA